VREFGIEPIQVAGGTVNVKTELKTPVRHCRARKPLSRVWHASRARATIAFSPRACT
jgi:hypothetical protein